MLSAERREETERIIKHRLKQIKAVTHDSRFGYLHLDIKDLVQPHRLAKKKAFGCHRSQCKMCHHAKLDDAIPETMV